MVGIGAGGRRWGYDAEDGGFCRCGLRGDLGRMACSLGYPECGENSRGANCQPVLEILERTEQEAPIALSEIWR